MWTSKSLYNFGKFVIIFMSIMKITVQEPLIEDHPQNATVPEGGTINLGCKFNETIGKCVWSRSGHVISIKDRYKYHKSTTNGQNTSDCSIEITGFNKIDATVWNCACTVDSSVGNSGCSSNSAYLTMTPWVATDEVQKSAKIPPVNRPTLNENVQSNKSGTTFNISLINLLFASIIVIVILF